MVTFISQRIKEAKDNSGVDAGKEKYRAYFVKAAAKKLYGKYQEEVDTVLNTDGYSDCIVKN